MIKRLAAFAAALTLTLIVAAPAFAQGLNQTLPISWDDSAYQGTETYCAGANLQPGQVLWHFVGHFSVSDPVASFTFADGTTYTALAPDVVNDHYEAQWTIITNETSLTAASVTPDTDSGTFNLSHICSSPPVVTPEAPMSALLVLSGGLGIFGFFLLRMRRSATGATIA